MKKTALIITVVLLSCSCGQDKTPAQKEGEHVYITDSLASQVNTHIPDSNKKEPDSLK